MDQIAVIASETHEKAVAYFNVAEQYSYKFIMEVKEIRDKQYYKALGVDSFEKYCETSWNTKRDFMDERILIAESFGNDWDSNGTYRQLGHTKSLMLARMEPERREELMTNPQQLPNGDTKTVDEMTVRQLKEVTKKLNQTESEVDRLFNESTYYQKLLNQERSKPQQVRQVQVEVLPSDYQDLKTQAVAGQKLNTENVRLQRQIQQLKEDTTRADEVALNCKKLKESFKNLLSIVNQEHYNAKFYFDQVAGSLQTFQIAQDFQLEFNEMINAVLLDWKDRTDINTN